MIRIQFQSKTSTFYQRKEKFMLPAINIPSNLLIAKQGQSLTLTTDFSRNRKAKLDQSIYLTILKMQHLVANSLFRHSQNYFNPLFDSGVCVVPQSTECSDQADSRLPAQDLSWKLPSFLHLVPCSPFAAHHQHHLLPLPPHHEQIQFYYTRAEFKHSSFTQEREKLNKKNKAKILNFNSTIKKKEKILCNISLTASFCLNYF